MFTSTKTQVTIIHMKRFVFWFVIPVLTVAALTGSGYYMIKEGLFNVKKVELEILEAPSPYVQVLTQRLMPILEGARGKPIWEFEVAAQTERLHREEWIDKIKIRRIWPNQILAQISAKKISANMIVASNIFIPISNDGSLFPRAKRELIPDHPVLLGKEFIRDEGLREKAIKQLESLPKTGPFTSGAISDLFLDKENRIWMRLIQDSIQVKIGDELPELKAERVAQVMNYLDEKQMDARVIDADFSKKVLVKPRHRR